MKYERHPEVVDAFRYDGRNLDALQAQLAAHVAPNGRGRLLRQVLPIGAYLVLQPNARWQVLGEGAFQRMYRRQGPPPAKRTCFECVHYAITDAQGLCQVFGETIDSETYAASDCDAYRPDATGS